MTLPLDLDSMIEAVRLWVASQLSGWTVIEGEQDAPSPAYPFATVTLLSPPAMVGRPQRRLIDNGATITNRSESDAEFEVSVQLFARTSDQEDPVSQLAQICAGLLDVGATESLGVAGLAVVSAGVPRKVPGIVGAKFERRASTDIRFRARLTFDVVTSTWLDQTSVGHTTVTAGAAGAVTGSVGT